MKGRNPKAEGRKKAEIRNPKGEGQSGCGARLCPTAALTRRLGREVSSFGVRVWAFFRPSGLGLRVLFTALAGFVRADTPGAFRDPARQEQRVKGRNPKAEGRKKAEVRNPKGEGPSGYGARLAPAAAATRRLGREMSSFGVRVSAFFRASGLGLRVSFPALALLIPQPSLPAATNALDPDAIPPLRPPHAEIPLTFWDQYSSWVIVFGVLLVALVCAVVWFLTRPKPPVVVPPEVQARLALEPLRQRPEDGALLSQVSQVLRHYLTAAFGLPPGELTTAECCRAIAGQGRIGPELSAALSDFLRQCDQRKFCPPPPAPPLCAASQALKLVEQTHARCVAQAQSAAQTTQGSSESLPKKA